VNARDGESVRGLGGAEEHGVSITAGNEGPREHGNEKGSDAGERVNE